LFKHNTDSAYSLINEINLSEYPDRFDQAYYYLLRSEISNSKEKYLLRNDSLLDIAYRYFEDRNDDLLQARVLLNKGRIWEGLDNHEDALNHYYTSIDKLDKTTNNELLSTAYTEIGDIYYNQLILDEALKMYDKSYTIDSLNGMKRNMAASLGNKGNTFLLLEKHQEALDCFDKAHQLTVGLSDSVNVLGNIYNSYGTYYSLKGNHQLALDYMLKSIQFNNGNEAINHKYLNLGEIYLSLNQSDSARYYLNRSVTSDNIYTKTVSFNKLYELEKSLGNLETAINCLFEYQIGYDSIVTLTYKTVTEKLAYQYNVEKAVLKVETETKITILILIILFFVLFLSLAIYFILRDKKRKLSEKEKEQEILRNQKEILEKEREINILVHKVNLMQANLSEFHDIESKVAQYEKLIESKKEELFILLKKNTDRSCEHFKKSPIYSKIMELSTQKKDKNVKRLTYQEQETLDQEIKRVFYDFIHELKNTFPSLTDDDFKLCCLSLLQLNLYTISLCFTVSGTNTIKQRRRRIKLKMSGDSENSFMYDFIFREIIHVE
jgi:tetratricopeptide (TPR) repeat protein